MQNACLCGSTCPMVSKTSIVGEEDRIPAMDMKFCRRAMEIYDFQLIAK
jgi:hypothetical protein